MLGVMVVAVNYDGENNNDGGSDNDRGDIGGRDNGKCGGSKKCHLSNVKTVCFLN